MSFADLETGGGHAQPNGTVSATNRPNTAFMQLQNSLSMQVFKINANVRGIKTLVDQLGTMRDGGNVRQSLHDLAETTQAMAKHGSADLAQLAALQPRAPHQKTTLLKTQRDFQAALVEFQKVQELSVQRQRAVVKVAKLVVDNNMPLDNPPATSSSEQYQAQLLEQQWSPHGLQHQQALVAERETEIREIESSIRELQELFLTIARHIEEQGDTIGDIGGNITRAAHNVEDAANELTRASENKRKAGRSAACLTIILVIVIVVVLLAILG